MTRSSACAALLLSAASPVFVQESRARAAKPLTVGIENPQGRSIGTATLTPAPTGVKIATNIKKLPPGEHSIHIHQAQIASLPTSNPLVLTLVAGGHPAHGDGRTFMEACPRAISRTLH